MIWEKSHKTYGGKCKELVNLHKGPLHDRCNFSVNLQLHKIKI